MLDFRVLNVVPPGGRYFYEVPETRYSLEDFTLEQLLTRVRKHMRENSLSVPEDLDAVIRDYMCKRLPEGFCLGDRGTGSGIRIFSMAEVQNNTRNLVRDNPVVVQGTAVDRAQICGKCAMNDRSACPTCTGAVGWAVKAIGGRSTGYEQILGICAIDGTLLPAKIYVSKIPDNNKYPETCWRNI